MISSLSVFVLIFPLFFWIEAFANPQSSLSQNKIPQLPVGQNCFPSSCAGKELEEIDLCVIDGGLDDADYMIASWACEDQMSMRTVTDPSGWDRVFRDLRQGCQAIRKLTIAGHGAPGYSGTGLHLQALKKIKGRPSCYFVHDSEIEFHTCLTGRGCQGALFMEELAESFLKGRGKGKISAPLNESYGVAYVLSPKTTTWRTLRTFPEKKSDGSLHLERKWSQETFLGTSIGGAGSRNSPWLTCRKEIQSLRGKILKEKKVAAKKGCLIRSPLIKDSNLLRIYQGVLKCDSSNCDPVEYSRHASGLQFQLEKLENCTPGGAVQSPSQREHPKRKRGVRAQ